MIGEVGRSEAMEGRKEAGNGLTMAHRRSVDRPDCGCSLIPRASVIRSASLARIKSILLALLAPAWLLLFSAGSCWLLLAAVLRNGQFSSASKREDG